MCISVANPHAENRVAINHRHYLCVSRDYRFALSCEKRYNGVPLPQTSQSQFADDEGVAKQPVVLDYLAQFCVTLSKVVDPN